VNSRAIWKSAILVILGGDVGELHGEYAVQFLQVPLDFGADALRIFIGIVFHFDFEKEIRATHSVPVLL
jgi:hypothetical protein